LTGDYRVARAAFDEAVKRRPGRIVTLRQKTRLLADSRTKKLVPASPPVPTSAEKKQHYDNDEQCRGVHGVLRLTPGTIS